MKLPRDLVMTAACATCGAKPGEPCEGRRGPRLSTHAARFHQAHGWVVQQEREERAERERSRRV